MMDREVLLNQGEQSSHRGSWIVEVYALYELVKADELESRSIENFSSHSW